MLQKAVYGRTKIQLCSAGMSAIWGRVESCCTSTFKGWHSIAFAAAPFDNNEQTLSWIFIRFKTHAWPTQSRRLGLCFAVLETNHLSRLYSPLCNTAMVSMANDSDTA
jgi:hypothetical protein